MAFWRRLLEGTSWQTLVGYVSPAFFQLVTTRDVSRTAYRLARNWLDDDRYAQAANERAASIASLDFGLSLSRVPRRKRDRLPFHSEMPAARQADEQCRTGEHALILFFHQLYAEGPVFLDIRRNHFQCGGPEENRSHHFRASPLYCDWTAEFRAAMRQLYFGFYGENAGGAYRGALRTLGIEVAADTFERAFGGERRTAARFQLSDFRVTFHEVFMRCLEAKATLHPDFLTLGIYIATLYDHLELDGGVYDVAACYQRATRSL